MNRVKPELVAPAGNMECIRAAAANGADAVYFGLQRFNARMRAENFTESQLPDLIKFLHERGVRAFCTLNTLVFTEELTAAEQQLILLDQAGVDAVIVQDIGLARLALRLSVRMAVHASTQMTITCRQGAEFLSRLGVKRVVIARETSLRELSRFGALNISLETFVHGALCVAYSGQCLTSEALGQRSANRGECAQACRLPYELIVDGVVKNLGDRRYLLSPQDLAAVREIPELIRLGVGAFKIEGRLKSPEYVAATTQVYRKAIDAAWEQEISTVSPKDEYKLEMTFSRGLYSGWMHGVNHQQLVHGRYGKKRGKFIGRVRSIHHDHVDVNLQGSIRTGDGVVFENTDDRDREQGGRVYEIRATRLFFKRGHIEFTKIKVGDRIWKTDDPHLTRELHHSFQKDIPFPKTRLQVYVSGRVGESLVLEANGCRVESSMPLEPAKTSPLTTEILTKQFGRLGGTRFILEDLTNNIEGSVILPISELNRMRRDLVSKLLDSATQPTQRCLSVKPILINELKRIASRPENPTDKKLAVLCRTADQLEAVVDGGCDLIYLDFEDLRRYSPAVELVRKQSNAEVVLATPRIQKSGEEGFFRVIEDAGPDGVLIRNLGGLQHFKTSTLKKIGDFSFNVANPLSAELLIQEGLDRVTISYDLNADQVSSLLRHAPPSWFELTIHQHMPMFHMEHCVFAAFLSSGTDHTNCGRPCDVHKVKLRDRVGCEHPLKADVGCRNTVYHAKAQSGAGYFHEFLKAGLRWYRVELLDEDADRTQTLLKAYQALLDEKILDGAVVTRQLNSVNQLGVTSGTLTVLG